jgi:signal transduction histidine kinase
MKSETNPQLLDKTDREGLINNQAFSDFTLLVEHILTTLEAERLPDFQKLKKITGRIKAEDADKQIFTRNLAALSKAIWEQDKLPGEIKLAWDHLLNEARDALHEVISDVEQPLLVAASYGLTYLMPTHEVKRGIDESMKILRRIRKAGELDLEQLNVAISHLKQAGDITRGLAKLALKTEKDTFNLKKTAEKALSYMRFKFERNNINYDIESPESVEAKGNENLMIMLLLNFLDNSFYWLLRKKENERELKIIVGKYCDEPIIIVSDSGPGFRDDISLVTLPFFTRKPDGMGLGLYIDDRIARMSGGSLRLLDSNDFPGLLSGANIAVCLKNIEKEKK